MKVDIYCKIYTDTYPTLEGRVTSKELYEHLISNGGACFDLFGNYIDDGNYCIWYLGTNEKFGNIAITMDDNVTTFIRDWDFGESSWKNVTDMLEFCKKHKIFSQEQQKHLEEIVKEGSDNFDSMYDISYYLSKKEDKEFENENKK